MNAALAIEAILQLDDHGFEVPEKNIRQALSTSHFPGRFEILRTDPSIILDGAHNPAKMKAFIQSLVSLYPDKQKVFVVAFKEEKQLAAMVSHIRAASSTIIASEFTLSTDTKKHASYKAEEIIQVLENSEREEKSLVAIPDVVLAMKKAKEFAKEIDGIVVVTGSLYLVGKVRTIYKDYLRGLLPFGGVEIET